ncbi:serine hydrolase [Chitinophaga niastensis]|nr:serine hydrolase [Chitinophaga niastensis]
MKNILLILTSWLLFVVPLHAQQPSANTVTARLEKNIPVLMQRDYIPGLTAAYIHHGKLVWIHHFGVANAATKMPVTDSTLFEAASLSKVVTAYAALKLVDAGLLNLDTPLNTYLGNNYDIGNDPRIHLITARRVLSHSAGFPNWRSKGDSLLPINFTPGERFSYSGEGFVYLAKVMEKITHLPYEKLIVQTVFGPLGMTHSSMVWEPAFQHLQAYRHDWLGNVSTLADYPQANAAASLRTTAKDYAAFLIAVLDGKGLKKATHEAMLTPQIKVDSVKQPQLAWGLGIGLEITPDARYCWHWGDQGDSKACFTANIDTRDAILYFTNSANGMSIASEMLELSIGGHQHEILAWLDYGKFDPAAADLVKAIKHDGATSALQTYQRQRTHVIGENQLNSMGYLLLRDKNITDAIAVFTQNTKDYPDSYNVWDSLAEAYMGQGNTTLAIQYYEKSLVLNPKNQNAVDKLKKLKKS